MQDLKCFLVFVFLLLCYQQAWSQQFELVGTDATNSVCNGEIELLYPDVDELEQEFDYVWSTGETGTKHLTGLCPGYYTITITLPDGCVIDLSIQLSGTGCYMNLDNFLVEIRDYCSEKEPGGIRLTSEFGLTYNYLWSNSATGHAISGLGQGSYCVTITSPDSGNECQYNSCYTVNVNPACSKPGKASIEKPIESVAVKRKDPVLIVNEFGQGSTNGEAYLELLVIGGEDCETIDIRDFIIDDNNGIFSKTPQNEFGFSKGHIRFSSHQLWKSVPAGALILIYNDEAKSETIALSDDPFDDDQDHVYILPLSHALFQNYYGFPNADSPNVYNKNNGILQAAASHSSWESISVSAFADGIQVRYPDGTYCHGISFGNIDIIHGGPDELQLLSTSGENKVFLFNGADYRNQMDYTFHNLTDGAGSPGYPNNSTNEAYIENLCDEHSYELTATHRNNTSEFVTEIFPNPFNKQFFVNIDSKSDQERPIQIKLLNLLNQEILLESHVLLPGENSFTVKAPSGLVNGVYQVNIHEVDHVITSKRIIFSK